MVALRISSISSYIMGSQNATPRILKIWSVQRFEINNNVNHLRKAELETFFFFHKIRCLQ